MTSYDGFNRAAQAYENEVPGEDLCICEPVVECPNCGTVYFEEDEQNIFCSECDSDGEGLIFPRPFTREAGDTRLAEQGCPEHGWCGGCSSRKCEDCN